MVGIVEDPWFDVAISVDAHPFAGTIDTIFALKGLERIGDHATNIAEQVLYMMGQDRQRADAA